MGDLELGEWYWVLEKGHSEPFPLKWDEYGRGTAFLSEEGWLVPLKMVEAWKHIPKPAAEEMIRNE